MIWLSRVSMIFSYVTPEIWSVSFQKNNKNKINFSVIWNSYLEPYELQVWKAFPHMQLVFSLSFVKLLWPFVRFISYSHDQDHIHVHSHAILLHWKIASTSIHPPTKINKTPYHTMIISIQKLSSKVWTIQKEIKDAYPKKVCHMPTRHVKKKRKREKMHTQRRCATHPQGVSKQKGEKENIAHTKNITREREII